MIEHKNVVVILIYNDSGEMALQLRAAHDDSFPLHWDFAAGGGIDPDEDPQTAAIRETKEELGIDVHPEFVSSHKLEYPAWNPEITRQIDIHIFKTTYNSTFNPDPNEVEKVEFFTLDTIQEMIDAGEKFHPEFLLTWKK